MSSAHWPFFGLFIRTPRLELRYPDDTLLDELVDVAARGVHPPGEMPFSVPWTDGQPPLLQRTTLQYWWGERASLRAAHWHIPLVAIESGTVCGVQSLLSDDFPVLRVVSTGSWLGLEHQGRGIGREMRAAALHLAFDGLGARQARSAAYEDNHASLAVSRALGYQEDGRKYVLRRDSPATQIRLVLDRDRWTRRTDISIHGLDGCLPVLGLS